MGEDLLLPGWAPAALATACAIFASTGCGGGTVGVSSDSHADGGAPFVGGSDDASATTGDAPTGPGKDAAAREAGAPAGDGGVPAPDSPDGGPWNVCRGRVPAQHRAAQTACAPVASTSDAAAMTCTTSADCADSGLGGFFAPGCVGGICEPYECLVDGDCGGGVCSCNGMTRAYAGSSTNACVAGNCRTDADCAQGAYCSPSYGTGGPFYGIQGYYCHSCEDVCTDNSDCTTCGGCILDPSVGHWVCGTSCAAG